MRKKQLLLAVAGMAVAATPAAADGMREHGYRYANAVHADHVDWTGLYSGLHSGGVTGKTTFVRRVGDTKNAYPSHYYCSSNYNICNLVSVANSYRNAEVANQTERSVDIQGFHIGPHVGYQKQFGNLVLGADLGFSVGGGTGDGDCGSTAATSIRCESEYKYSVNLRGRIGFARGNSLFYIMGGITRARLVNTVTYVDNATGVAFGESGAAYPNGIIAGLGWEYQDARGMRWSLSYTHLFLDEVNVRLRDPFGGYSGTRTTPDPDVLGAALKIPLQQQATQAADPGLPAAQAPAVAQAQVPQTARPAATPAAAPAATPARTPAATPAAAPAAPAATTAPTTPRAPAARAPVPGAPAEPDTPAPAGRPQK